MALCISGTLAMHIFVPALPVAARDLGVSSGTIQLTLTLYLVGVAGGQLFWGPLSDRIGRRPALLAGIALYTIGSLASAAAPGVGTLILARVIQAIGGCSGLVLGRAVLRDVSNPREAAASLALMNLFMSIGPAMAPLVGGLGAAWFGWRFVFLFLAALGALTLFSTFRQLRETHTERGHARGVIAGYLRLLAIPEFRRLTLGGACSTTSFYAFLAAAPFIFADHLHRPQAEIGFYFVVPILGFSIGAILANRLVQRFAPTRIMLISSLVACLGALLFGALEAADALSVPAVLGPILIFCIGSGIVSPLALTSAISVQPGMIGAAAGLYGCAQMGYGAFCTLMVSQFHTNPAEGAAIVLVASTLAGLAGIIRATRPPPP
jgi:DHA1 family bicyclomycin/chloramphenicol resistance-like MFS transporter